MYHPGGQPPGQCQYTRKRQCKLDVIYKNVKKVTRIDDDLLILGYDEDGNDHDIAITEYLKVSQANGLKISFDKIYYKVKEVQNSRITITIGGHQLLQMI